MDPLQFYGIDWLAIASGLSGVYLLGNRNRLGFVAYMVASVGWMIFGTITESYAVIIGSFIFLILHTRGLYKWVRQEASNTGQQGCPQRKRDRRYKRLFIEFNSKEAK